MPRVTAGAARHRKHKRVLKAARGMHGRLSRNYRLAKNKTFRAECFATRDRRVRKRDFRRLWITRISAACRMRGLRYNQFMFALTESDVELNRKMLAEIAVVDPKAFDAVLEMVKEHLKEPLPA